MRSKRNKAGYTAIPKKCDYCSGMFKASREDQMFCHPNCRKAKHREKERLEKEREVKRLEKKGILSKMLTDDKVELLESLRELERSARDLRKSYEDSLTEQRPEVQRILQELILLHFNNIEKGRQICEDDFLKVELTGDGFNYQVWDILEGRTFERDDESQAWDDDDTETMA